MFQNFKINARGGKYFVRKGKRRVAWGISVCGSHHIEIHQKTGFSLTSYSCEPIYVYLLQRFYFYIVQIYFTDLFWLKRALRYKSFINWFLYALIHRQKRDQSPYSLPFISILSLVVQRCDIAVKWYKSNFKQIKLI